MVTLRYSTKFSTYTYALGVETLNNRNWCSLSYSHMY